MTFKNKLTIAFSGVLFLTIIVSFTNWWGMGSALKAQKSSNSSTAVLVQQFQEIVREEQAYRSTNDISYSRAVITLLADLKNQIDTLTSLGKTEQHSQVIRDALAALESYEKSFLGYSRTSITMQTMQSRMLKESQRLLLNAGKLLDTSQHTARTADNPLPQALGEMKKQLLEQTVVTGIVYLVGTVLLSEKDFILSGEEDAVTAVNNAIHAIRKQTRIIEQEQTGGTDKLKAFRVSKIATLYLDIFNEFVTEKRKLSASSISMQNSRDSFSRAMSLSLEQQQALSKEKIATLQYLSVAVSVLAVLLGIAAVVILSNMITRPINELKKSVRTIVDGDLETYVNIDSDDDIGKLGTLFNQMTKQLRKSFYDIGKYRDHLEELVRERTEKLEQEIAKQQTTKEALRTSSERLTNIIEQSPMGIVIFDKEFKIQSWNASCETIFGYSRQEIVGETAHWIVEDDAMARVDDIFNTQVQDSKNIRNRNKNITKAGQVITCEWYNTCLTDSTGEMIGMLSLVEDVTEQIQLETEQLKRKKLESTGVLAGGIAHDFNNILTVILGNINLSLLDPALSEQTQKLLLAAEKGSNRAQDLTQQLLTFAKGGEPIKTQTSLVDVIRDSADFVLHGSASSCHYHFPDDLWLVDADKGQISQVVQNIVINASHAMPGGGTIDIRCSNIEKEIMVDNILPENTAYVEISISDTGVGIPGHSLERIFDPYYSTKKEGSGLGLAISQAVIRKHKGQISVSSEADSGTTFTIYLPATREVAQHAATVETVESMEPTEKVKILLMDDEEMILDIASQMLMALGHQVVTARDGDECIRVYQEDTAAGCPPDLLIMDLTIPGGKGGAETLAELLLINPHVKAIVSSGYSNDPLMSSYLEHGFCGTIPKPYILADMEKNINRALFENS